MRLPPKKLLWLVCLVLVLGSIPLVQAECRDNSPGRSYCGCLYNLMPENVVPPDTPRLHGPAVVDINPANGNLLVRGPLPLVIRKGPGTEKDSPCMNSTDWYFAYDELNTTISTSQYRPVYLMADPWKKEKLDEAFRTFNLSEYELVVISLIKHTGADNNYLAVEKREFGGTFSQCSAELNPGTLRGQKAYLIWSPVGFCDKGELDQTCSEILYNDTADYCSYYHLIDQITSLMQENSGKKRLIYYHCVQGTDRTGGVTIGYLLKNYPENMTYFQALAYAQFLGNAGRPPNYDPPNKESQYLAHAYCLAINGSCATAPHEGAADEPGAPFVALAHPGGEAGLPVSYIFEDYDETNGSSSQANTVIHHVHMMPATAIVEPVLKVEQNPKITEAQKLAGRIFTRYYDIDLVNIPDASVTTSSIEFSVREGYLRSLGISPGNVTMLRRDQDRWVELPTVLETVMSGRAYYTARTPGFSYFVITNRVPEAPATAGEPVVSRVPMTPPVTPLPAPPQRTGDVPAPVTSATHAPSAAPIAEVPPPKVIPLSAVIGVAGLVAAGGLVIRSWWIRRQNPALFRKDD